MPEGLLEKINSALISPVTDSSKQILGIGIRNVSDRLSIMFGQSFKMYYESEFGKGTSVHLWIPIIDDLIELEGGQEHD